MADENKDGTLQRVLDEINKVHDTGKENHGEIVALKAKSDQLERDMATLEQKAAAELDVLKATLKGSMGETGAEDFANEVGKFLRGVYCEQKLRRPSTEIMKDGSKASDVVNKAATTFVTTGTTDGGFLLPQYMRPGITELKDIYGNLYPMLTKFQVPPGVSAPVNSQSANPVAVWRSAQGSAMTESGAGSAPNDNPMAFARDTIVTQLLYVYQTMANEILLNPSISFGALAATQGIKAIIRKLEYDVLAAASAPSAGVVASSTDQGTIGSATFALTGAFIKASIADNAYAIDPTSNKLFLHPRDAITLALQAVGASELTGMLVWGDPRKGIPTTLLGYEVVIHPGCNNGTNNYMFLGDPMNIILGETGNFGVDFSEHAKFIEFETAMRVYSHFDWSVQQTTEWHRTIVTA